jgi:hypothetical protein
MGKDSAKVEETMKNVGLHESNIQKLLNSATGVTEHAQSNKELLTSKERT